MKEMAVRSMITFKQEILNTVFVNSLVTHDTILSTHDTILSTHDTILNTHDTMHASFNMTTNIHRHNVTAQTKIRDIPGFER